jgi:hypothetical protein
MSDEPNSQPGLLTRIRPLAAISLGAFGLLAIASLVYSFWNAIAAR